MVLVIDNYDSFTYNLVELVRRDTEVMVLRNDECTVSQVAAIAPMGILISPGPGRPEDSGVSGALIREFVGQIPILGICLGHQLIAELYGGKVIHGQLPMHGKTSVIHHDGKGLFEALPQRITVMRYHSLVVEPNALPACLMVSAWGPTGEIMGIRHKFYNLAGVQFHPESILSPEGPKMIRNWIASLSPFNVEST